MTKPSSGRQNGVPSESAASFTDSPKLIHAHSTSKFVTNLAPQPTPPVTTVAIGTLLALDYSYTASTDAFGWVAGFKLRR
jgi:hypothetical protein